VVSIHAGERSVWESVSWGLSWQRNDRWAIDLRTGGMRNGSYISAIRKEIEQSESAGALPEGEGRGRVRVSIAYDL